MLEQRLSKQQILTLYVNQTYMGQRGSFSINGFGEAAKPIRQGHLSSNLPEAATWPPSFQLQTESSRSTKHPDEVKRRRNTVLASMPIRSAQSVTKTTKSARTSDQRSFRLKIDASDAPYLVDYIREELLQSFSEDDITNGGLRVYTSLDPAFQKIAVESVQNGLKFVDEQLAAQKKRTENDR